MIANPLAHVSLQWWRRYNNWLRALLYPSSVSRVAELHTASWVGLCSAQQKALNAFFFLASDWQIYDAKCRHSKWDRHPSPSNKVTDGRCRKKPWKMDCPTGCSGCLTCLHLKFIILNLDGAFNASFPLNLDNAPGFSFGTSPVYLPFLSVWCCIRPKAVCI